MGMVADLKTLSSVDPTLNASANKRILKRYIENLETISGDPPYLSRDAVSDEIQSIAQHVPTVSGGDFTLLVKLFNGETFTTAAIAFAANAATIEGAIDTAATGVITGWTNGDITVAGGDLNTAPVTLTFDGTSVAGQKHFLTVIDGTGLTGGGSAGAVSVSTNGQANRPALAVMNLIGLTGDTQPIGSLPVSADYANAKPGSLHLNPNELVLKMLADEAGIEAGKIGVGSAAVRDKHLELMRVQGFAV